MGNRVARSLERLLKIKSVDPNHKFVGADAEAYEAFIEKQKQETLLAEIEAKEAKKASRKKNKKVKQIIPEEIVETGESEPEEYIAKEEFSDNQTRDWPETEESA